MRPRNRKTKICKWCGNSFIRNQIYCSRECYFADKGKKITGKTYFFKCEVCGKSKEIDYKTNWIIKKNKQTKCFTCSRLKKGETNSGGFKIDIIPWNKGMGTKTPIYARIRNSKEFKKWRELVYERDNWTCQKCLERGQDLNPHHIYNFSDNENIRFDIDNGVTLCRNCHYEFHNKYGYKNNTKEQLEKFLKGSIINNKLK